MSDNALPNQIGLVIVTHGSLGAELLKVLEHVVGPQENIAVVSIGPEDDMEETRLNILESVNHVNICLLYTSPSPRDCLLSRMPSSA